MHVYNNNSGEERNVQMFKQNIEYFKFFEFKLIFKSAKQVYLKDILALFRLL